LYLNNVSNDVYNNNGKTMSNLNNLYGGHWYSLHAIAQWIHDHNQSWTALCPFGAYNGCAPTLTMFKGSKTILFRFRTYVEDPIIWEKWLKALREEDEDTRMEILDLWHTGCGASDKIENECWLKITVEQFNKMNALYEESCMETDGAEYEYKLTRREHSLKKPNLLDYSKL
tara:strand:+ start:143 stop:658 length:516 start_codon:yes stop_codon:yes gene_type:complete